MNEFRRCAFCGAVVVFDDERHIAGHSEPVCDGWQKQLDDLVAAGFMANRGRELHEVPDDLPAAPSTGLAPTEPSERKENDN